MFKQAFSAYVGVLMLLGISNSYSFEQSEQNCVALKQCTSNGEDYLNKWTDKKNISEIDYYNKQYFAHKKEFFPTNLPLLPIIFAHSKYLPNGQCKEDTQLFLKELQNETFWAMQSKYMKNSIKIYINIKLSILIICFVVLFQKISKKMFIQENIRILLILRYNLI